MKPEEQRIAIAEALGWRRVKTQKRWNNPSGGWDYLCDLPKFTEDLNACNKMEDSLDLNERKKFREILSEFFIPKDAAIHAKAHQRCIAFLKVKGLWKEGA